MKNTVVIITVAILGMLMCMMVDTIYGRMDRFMELESNLSSVVEETLEDIVSNDSYDNQNMDAVMKELAKTLFAAIDVPAEVTIDVLQCDMQKGMLSVRVTLSYAHPNEEIGTVVCERHVILNEIVQGG